MIAYLGRFFRWLISRIGLRTLLSLFLLYVALRGVALGLVEVARGLDASLATTAAIGGMLLAWVLGKLAYEGRVRGWLAGLAIVVIGIAAITVRVGQLGDELLAIVSTAPPLLAGLFRWRADGPPDITPLLVALIELLIGLGTLLARLAEWLLAIANQQAAFDPVGAALLWSLAIWLVAGWAGWAVRRHEQPLQGVIPALALLAFIRFAARASPNPMLVPLGAALLLAALVSYNAHLTRWQASNIDLPDELWLDAAKAAIPLAFVLITSAWVLPSISIRDAVESFQKLFRQSTTDGDVNPIPDSLGLNRQTGQVSSFDYVRAPGLPRSHLLTGGPELEHEVALLVTLRGLPPGEPPPRYYWRSVTYDRYTGRGWLTSGTQTIEYRANEASTAPGAGQRVVEQEVRIMSDQGGLLYAAGTLVTANQEYSVAWRANEDYFGANIEGDRYRAISTAPVYSEDQLRTAGSDYPGWVLDRYLALPADIPPRVLDLARNLTATEPTPYDRARAIEKYLRTYPYTLDIAAPPPRRDVVDYFLFDLKRGYCDYYATSMVVLARAAGLPARLVIGYVSGAYDTANRRYIVVEADAHSWVEVYFPGYGWIEFEPTGGRAEIDRPSQATVAAFAEQLESTPQPELAQQVRPTPQGWLVVLIGVGSLIVVGVGWAATEGLRLNRLSPGAAAAEIYRRLRRHGWRLAVPAQAGDTPDEFANSFTDRLADLAVNPRWAESLTTAAQEARWLIALHTQASYSPHPPSAVERARAVQTWFRLRRQLWMVWALHPARRL